MMFSYNYYIDLYNFYFGTFALPTTTVRVRQNGLKTVSNPQNVKTYKTLKNVLKTAREKIAPVKKEEDPSR